MLVERNHNGSYSVCAVIGGRLRSRTYYGFSKREAVRLFRQDCDPDFKPRQPRSTLPPGVRVSYPFVRGPKPKCTTPH